MARGDATIFNEFVKDIGDGTHDLSGDTIKLGLLTNGITPNAADTTPTWDDYSLHEVSTAGGYVADGITLTNVTYVQLAGTARLNADDVSLAQSVTGFTNAYWGVVYNSSAGNAAIMFIDLGGPLSEQAGPISINLQSLGMLVISKVATVPVETPAGTTDNALTRWNGTDGSSFNNSVATLDDNGILQIISDTGSVQLGVSNDVKLYRDGANALALRNSTTAQSFALYNTYTDAANYERVRLYWDTNAAYLETQNLGTGTQRALYINASVVYVRAGGLARFTASSSACRSAVSLQVGSDAAYLSLGASDDIKLYRDAAAQLAIRDGATAQSLAVYNTYTSASVYERVRLYWDSNTAYLRTEHVGGTQRELELDGNTLRLRHAGTTKITVGVGATFDCNIAACRASGGSLGIKYLTELTTIAAAATTSTTIQVPANCLVLGVSIRVTVQPPGTTTVNVGDGSTVDKFGAAISTAATTTNASLHVPYASGGSPFSIVFTPDSTPSDATGRIRTTIHYIDLTAPTS